MLFWSQPCEDPSNPRALIWRTERSGSAGVPGYAQLQSGPIVEEFQNGQVEPKPTANPQNSVASIHRPGASSRTAKPALQCACTAGRQVARDA